MNKYLSRYAMTVYQTWLSIVRKISGIGIQPVVITSQAGCLCHIQKRTVIFRTMLSLLCVVFASGLASAKDFLGQASLLEVLPETTQFLFTSQNVQNSYQVLERTDIGKQLSGPLWQTVLAKQKTANAGSLLNPRPWLGLDWQDISGIDQAGAVAAILDSNRETSLLFLAKLGPNADKHPFVQRWMENQGGLSRFLTVSTNDGTKFYSLRSDGKSKSSACIAIGSQWTCLSSSSQAVQQWLGSPTMKSMQASALPASIQPAFESGTWGNGETRFWLSPWALLNNYAAKKEPKLQRSAKLFGLDGLGVLSGALMPPSPTDASWKLNYSLQLPPPLAKGLAMFSFKSGPMVEPPKILTDAMDQVAISYLDMKPWFQGLSHAVDQMIDEETPGNFADLVDSLLTDPEGPKVDVRKELIYPSGPLMFNFGGTSPDKKNPGQLQHNQIWAVLLPEATKASVTVNKLFENDKDIQAEQIGPFRVWSTVNDESLFVAVGKGENQTISAAAIDEKYLYLSTDTMWLKGLLSGTGVPAGVNRGRPALWSSHLKMMKSPAFSMQQAIYLRSWFELSWNRLPEPTHKEYGSMDLPSFCLTNVLIPGVAKADVPKWNQVQSAFGIVTQTAVQNERGIDGTIRLFASP